MKLNFIFVIIVKCCYIKVVSTSRFPCWWGKDDRTGTRHRGCRSGEASSRIYGKNGIVSVHVGSVGASDPEHYISLIAI